MVKTISGKLTLKLFLYMTLVISMGIPTLAEELITIRGQVVAPEFSNSEKLIPVAGVKIILVAYSISSDTVITEDGDIVGRSDSILTTVSDENGVFIFENIQKVEYVYIEASMDGYYSNSLEVNSKTTEEKITIILKPIPTIPTLPEGLSLSAALGSEQYSIGEKIDVTLTVTNSTERDITINTVPYNPLQYALDSIDPWLNQYREFRDTYSSTIPAGGSVTFEGTYWFGPYLYKDAVDVTDKDDSGNSEEPAPPSDMERGMISPGIHTLYVSLTGYKNWAEAQFTIADMPKKVGMAGYVNGYTDKYEYRLLDSANVEPLAGAVLTLKPDPNAWYYFAGDDWSTYANNMPASDAEPQTVTSDDAGRFFFDEVYCGAWYILEAKKDGYFPVTMTLMGYSADDSVSVMLRKINVVPELPDGIDLTVQTGKDSYALGETVEFIVSLTNTTLTDIQLEIMPEYPLKYMIDRVDSLYEQWMYIRETETITIPAGGSKPYSGRLNGPWYTKDVISSAKSNNDYNSDGQIDTEPDTDDLYRHFTIAPGSYTLYAGFIGYKNWAETSFSVTDQLLMGTLSGIVITPSSDRRMSESEPLPGVTLTLSPVEYLLENVRLQEKWIAESNEDGTFVIENVPVGLGYRLQADIEGFNTYYEYLTLYSPDTHMKVWLRRNEPMPPTPMAIDRRTFDGLIVTFGTDRSVYEPGAVFEAIYTIKNDRTEPVTFSFDNDNFIEWTVISPERDTLWSYADTFYNEFDDENNSGEAPAATFEFTLDPGEAREFTWEGSLGEVIIKADSKYIVSGQLAFRNTSIDGFTAEKTKCSVIVIVTTNDSMYYRVDGEGKQNIEADFGESLGASLDCTMKNNVDGSAIRVTKVERNVHAPLENHRYITMYEVDADLAVREELSNARIRIYYDPADLGEDVDPKTLVIAHWVDNANWDGSNDDMEVDTSNGTWEILESSVNQEEQYVEANATSFSSFALFEAFEQAGVEENNVSRPFTLMQNSPNPFNPVTTIQFTLPDAGIVSIDVYNMAGQKVDTIADEFMSAGSHSVMWNASGFSAGVYFCTVKTAHSSKSMKMTLLK